MGNLCGTTLGEAIYKDIDTNEYLNELYKDILFNYSIRLFGIDTECKQININDALHFADILSKSNNNINSDKHRIWAQEIVALLKSLYPQDSRIDYYMGSVLTNTGNYYGMCKVAPDYKSDSLLDRIYDKFSKDYMSIPAEPELQFIRSQKLVYENLTEPYFSYSAPTSMGKSFVMRMFIKKQIIDGVQMNFALLVPTKALINEVTSKIINDLKDLLSEHNYRLVTSAGALVLKQDHNFIFVLTPERLLYLMIGNPNIKIDYLFVDEAHKISSKDARSAFYYKVVDMLSQQEPKPHIIFASPNIPNPEVYLKLIPDIGEITEHKMTSSFAPVSQVKYLIDFVDGNIRLYNSYKGVFIFLKRISESKKLSELVSQLGRESQNIIYCSSTAKAIENAQDYAANLIEQDNNELSTLSRDIINEVHGDYYLAKLIKKGVAYHIGYLPATIRIRIEDLFKRGFIRTMFCTSTLIEGVNLPADNLFITSYKNGLSNMKPVDFKNLIGRVGRIDYNLYGNVFLVRMSDKLKKEQFEDLLQLDISEQKLSLVTELTKKQKELVVDCLLKGNIELIKYPEKQTADNYSLMRKFALILLSDIEKGRNSVVRQAFEPYLNDGDAEIIKAAFANDRTTPDDDINISADQISNLASAIAGGLKYPDISSTGILNYNELVSFLEKLCKVFKWDKYESQTLGKKSLNGTHSMLKWYAVVLAQWMQGTGLSNIMTKAIEYKKDHPQYSIMDNGILVDYDGSLRHNNIVISEALGMIENVILFSISNYFLRFSEEYKRYHKVDSFPNDWYEYVEYGTTNPLTIILQRSGFSRETSTYIKKHRSEYVVIESNGDVKLKKSLIDCGNISVSREAADIRYNIPELFIDNDI